MSDNTFGTLFRFTTWGESHGPAIGCVVDGTPPNIPLTEADIQGFLDRRRPGTSKFVTQRKEPDTIRILSGVFEGMTTGTPISMMIDNVDNRSKDYDDNAAKHRPGHADFTYQQKYGIRDHRGGGRSSARETASRVAAGAIARKILGDGIKIRGALVQVGTETIDRAKWDWDEIERNPFFCPDAAAAAGWEPYLDGIRKDGSSVGAVVEVVASGVPPGWGAPVYGKLDAELAAALTSINAVKGVEIGAGFATARMRGEENSDEMRNDNGRVVFKTNNAGGILGGISSGQDILARFAVKPTSSILISRRTAKTLKSSPRGATIHPRGPRRRGDGGLRARRPDAATPGPSRLGHPQPRGNQEFLVAPGPRDRAWGYPQHVPALMAQPRFDAIADLSVQGWIADNPTLAHLLRSNFELGFYQRHQSGTWAGQRQRIGQDQLKANEAGITNNQ